MEMRIELDPGMPLLPSPDNTPRVAMETDFSFFAGIGNGGSQDMMIEDPARRDSREAGNVCDIPFLLVQDHDG